MTIYDRLVNDVKDGKKFYVDLESKTLKIGKAVVINSGDYKGDLIGDLPCDPWEMAEKLFFNFYHSKPSAWSDKKRSYFAAKSVQEMDEFELAAGESRLVAQAKLEGFILCAVLAGYLKWNSLYGNWFWKSCKYPEFVLLKNWF